MLDVVLRLLAVAVLVLLNGFFVAAEFALVAARSPRLQRLAAEGDWRARAVLAAQGDPNRFIAAAQLGITMASLGLGWVGEAALADLFGRLLAALPGLPAAWRAAGPHLLAVPLAFALITFLHITLGEQVPKMIALHAPVESALRTVGPTEAFARLFRPFIALLYWAANGFLGLLGLRWREADHYLVHSADELKLLVAASRQAGVLDPQEERMVERAVDFGELAVRQVMVPRTELVAIPADAGLPDLLRLAATTGYRKFPVHLRSGGLDQIVGLVYIDDALRLLADQFAQEPGGAQEAPGRRRWQVQHLMRPAFTVPETVTVARLLPELRRRRQRAAVVVDEYGGTAGFVTWGQLLERIVGEVPDSAAQPPLEMGTLADGTVLVSGQVLVDDLNDHLGLHLDRQGYDTVAGYLMAALGRVPAPGDTVMAEGFRLRVERMDGLRVDLVRVIPPGPAPDATRPVDGPGPGR